MKRFALIRAVAVMVVAVCSSSAFAQLDRKNILDASIMLLGNQPVQTDLKLTASQKDVIMKSFQAYAEKAMELLAKLRKDRTQSKKLNAILDEHQVILANKCKGVLSAQQKTRLGQIGIQHWGPFVTVLPDVAAKLKITPDQTKRIKAAKTEYEKYRDDYEARQKKLAKSVPQPKKTDKAAVDAYRKKLQKIMSDFSNKEKPKLIAKSQAADTKVLAILTQGQRAQLKTMEGAKLKQ